MRRFASWLLAAVFGFSVFYVVYAHLVSVATARHYTAPSMIESFSSKSDLARNFQLRGDGALSHDVSGGELRITGRTSTGTHLEFASERRSLEEATVSMRFKVATRGAYDVMLGLESDRSGEGHQEIRYGLRNESKEPAYAWEGNPLHTMPGIRGRGLPGEEVDEKAMTPFDDPDEWHEVSLAVSTSLHRIAAFVDGVPTGSVVAEWLAGLPVRVVFGVRAREPDQDVDMSIAKVVYEPRAGEAQALDWTDRFDGKVIDPRRWSVHSFASDLLSANLRPTRDGLVAHGYATTRITSAAAAFILDTPSFPLSSVYARAVVQVRQLRQSAFFMGITSSLGGSHLRYFDTGFHGDERTSMVAGHWGRDAQVRFDPPVQRSTNDLVTLEVEYDAKTRIARAKMDGNVTGEHVSDLQAREHARFRFGVVLDDPEAKFDLTVKEIRVRALGD